MVKETERRERQKSLILNTARRLFWMNGYSGTSIRDIANDSHIEPSNIYYYFASKELLLYKVLKEEHNEIVSLIRRNKAKNDDPVKRLYAMIKVHVTWVLGEMRVSKVLFDSELKHLSRKHLYDIYRLRAEYNDILISIIRDGKKNGDFNDFDEKIACNIIANIIVRTRMWYKPEGKLSTEELAEYIFQFIYNALKDNGKADH